MLDAASVASKMTGFSVSTLIADMNKAKKAVIRGCCRLCGTRRQAVGGSY